MKGALLLDIQNSYTTHLQCSVEVGVDDGEHEETTGTAKYPIAREKQRGIVCLNVNCACVCM